MGPSCEEDFKIFRIFTYPLSHPKKNKKKKKKERKNFERNGGKRNGVALRRSKIGSFSFMVDYALYVLCKYINPLSFVLSSMMQEIWPLAF